MSNEQHLLRHLNVVMDQIAGRVIPRSVKNQERVRVLIRKQRETVSRSIVSLYSILIEKIEGNNISDDTSDFDNEVIMTTNPTTSGSAQDDVDHMDEDEDEDENEGSTANPNVTANLTVPSNRRQSTRVYIK